MSSLLAGAIFASTERTPKAIENGSLERAPVIEAVSASSITADTMPAYQAALDGTRYTIVRVRSAGAEAIRMRFDNIRLPEGVVLLVYGSDANSPWIYTGGLESTAIVSGEIANIEVQCSQDCPSDLPFEIVEAEATSKPSDVVAQAEVSEYRRGNFHGVDVDYQVRDGLAVFQGDMVLGRAEEIEPARGSKKGSRDAAAISGNGYRWPGGKIPYVIAADIPNPSRITAAIAHWNQMLAGVIALTPRTSQGVYLNFIRSNGCSSNVGMYSTGNYTFVGDSCSAGNITHEIGHIVGLWHEQSREDRNSHIKINWNNIISSALVNFGQAIVNGDDIGGYDFGSIMHYPAYAYSLNGQATIETIPAGIPIGQRNGLSTGDIAAVRKMYGAAPTTPTSPAPQTVAVTITSNPVGESMTIDNVKYNGSAVLTWTVGSSHTIIANNANAAGRLSTFANWSDAGAQSHTVVAAAATTLYKATFSVKYQLTAGPSPANSGAVSVSPASTDRYYASGTYVGLSATAAPGYCFTGWTGLIGGTPAQTTVTMTKAYNLSANFQQGTISLAAPILYAAVTGGSFTLGITGSSGCTWTATSSMPWITINAPSAGSGSGVLRYTVAKNTSTAARVGIISVGGWSFFISQAGI